MVVRLWIIPVALFGLLCGQAFGQAASEPTGKVTGEQIQSRPGEVPGTVASRTQDAPPSAGLSTAKQSLVIAGWAGAYGQAQAVAILEPYRRATQYELKVLRRKSGAELGDLARADVVELSERQLHEACRTGRVVPLGRLSLAASGNGKTAPADDFIGAGLTRCGIGSFVWSALFVVDPSAFKSGGPRSIKDVFNRRKFKGSRAIIKSPRNLLEMALLADGVRPGNVYARLATKRGVHRALRRLNRIRKRILWVSNPSEALAHLANGRARFAMTYSGRAFRETVSRRYRMIWNGSVYDVSYWAVPSTAKNPSGAREFIAFATAPQRLARQAQLWPYGPTRLSAIAMVGRHRHLDIDLAPYLPTTPDNLKMAVRRQALFWEEHGARIEKTFKTWLAGKLKLLKKRRKYRRKSKRNRRYRRRRRH